MTKQLFKKLIPHIIAVVIFLVISIVYCYPVLEGKVLEQHDVLHWKGAFQNSVDYSKTHNGNYPMWTNNVFSGMPTIQIGGMSGTFIQNIILPVMTLWLPKPMHFFFLACVCFYLLCLVLRVNPYIGIVGAVSFAFATYNPIIIAVGHETKMLSVAFMPVVLASILLIFNHKKYWWGAFALSVAMAEFVSFNHVQIVYYFMLAVGIITLVYVAFWIKKKEIRHLSFSLIFAAVALAIGVAATAKNLLSTFEYQKHTIRGGSSELADKSKQDVSTSGLTKDYAFSYSMNLSEPLTMLVPRMFGGSSDKPQVSEESSKAVEAVRNLPQEMQQAIFQYFPFFNATADNTLYPITYWGGIGSTSGPAYVGAIICFLAILGFFIVDKKYSIGILAAIIFSILISYGKYLESFNIILFNYLPFFNKFRSPSMILVIPQLLLNVMAVLSLQKIISSNKKEIFPKLKKGLITTAAIFGLLFIFYMSFSFLSTEEAGIPTMLKQNGMGQAVDSIQQILNGLKSDRESLMLGDIFRSLIFILIFLSLLYFYAKKKLNTKVLILSTAVLVLIDLLVIDKIYLNNDSFSYASDNELTFAETIADKQLLQDTSFFRVFCNSRNAIKNGDQFSENITSYRYHSVGGYHPAKLSIYNDLIEKKLRVGKCDNIFDMLNTKYFIQKNIDGQTTGYNRRYTALGNAWFVEKIDFLKSQKEVMNAMDSNFNAKKVALVADDFKKDIPFATQYDSTAKISLIKNDNDIVTYSAETPVNQFAVFSEIYYDGGWTATIDGKAAPIVRTNYVLRGLAIPAGKHEIKFEFVPKGFKTGKIVSNLSLVAMLILVVVASTFSYKKIRVKQ